MSTLLTLLLLLVLLGLLCWTSYRWGHERGHEAGARDAQRLDQLPPLVHVGAEPPPPEQRRLGDVWLEQPPSGRRRMWVWDGRAWV